MQNNSNSDNLFDFHVEPVKSSDGSCLISSSEGTVLCTVNGPSEVKFSQEIIDKATIEVNVSVSGRPSDPREREIALFLKRIAERVILTSMHPRSLISICFQEISSSSNSVLSLPAMVNGMCVALANASIPLTALFVCTVQLMQDNRNVLYSVSFADGNCISCLSLEKFSLESMKNQGSKAVLACVEEQRSQLLKSIKEKLINFYIA